MQESIYHVRTEKGQSLVIASESDQKCWAP